MTSWILLKAYRRLTFNEYDDVRLRGLRWSKELLRRPLASLGETGGKPGVMVVLLGEQLCLAFREEAWRRL